MPAKPRVEILADPADVAKRAAAWIVERIALKSGAFRMALSGGGTPRPLYSELASPEVCARIDWGKVELFWGDERFVPHDDERSNYRMARETLLDRVPIPEGNVHPISTQGDPETAALSYESVLKDVYGARTLAARTLFDLVLLGIGEDGHTASLFPGDPALKETKRWTVPVSERDMARITLTYPALNSSDSVLFLVTGEEKAQILKRVLGGDSSLPAARVRSQGETIWMVDRAAASLLAPGEIS